MRFLLLSALLSVGCDPVTAPEADAGQYQRFQPGSRIHLRALEGTDGSREILGFWDDIAGIPCNVERASDGALRCLPDASVLATRSDLYSDANCTTAIVGWSGNAPPAGVAPANPGGQIRRIGARYTGPIWAELGLGLGCVSGVNPLVIRPPETYEIGSTIPVNLFVEFNEVIVP
jgi:hypothetical protein